MSTLSSGNSGAAPKPDLGISFSWVNRYGTDYLVGEMVQFGQRPYHRDEAPCWYRVIDDYGNPYADLVDFSVELTLYETNYSGEGLRRSVFESAEYRSVHSVKLERAEGMVRVLRKLRKSLDQASEQDGYAPTIGHFVVRVARALGVKTVIFDASLSPEYSDSRYFRPNADTIRAVDHILDHFRETGRNVWQDAKDEAARRRRERAHAEAERQREQREALAAEQAEATAA